MSTEGGLLNGRVIYQQPATGFRSGIEPVLLAASVPARPGQRILEAGAGAGAALLCLHARVPDIGSTGVEVDAEMAGLAAANAAANGIADMALIAGPIESVSLDRSYDHAIANPPYHHPAGSPSPSQARERAKRGTCSIIGDWVAGLAAHLHRRSTLTLIVPSWQIPACLTAMAAADCSSSVIYPLWPKIGRPAKLVLVRGVNGSRSPLRLAAGLILHQEDGSFTEAAQAILRDGAALDLR